MTKLITLTSAALIIASAASADTDPFTYTRCDLTEDSYRVRFFGAPMFVLYNDVALITFWGSTSQAHSIGSAGPNKYERINPRKKDAFIREVTTLTKDVLVTVEIKSWEHGGDPFTYVDRLTNCKTMDLS